MGRLYLIRHGETDSNKSFRFQGQTDIELNEKGLAQAELLAEHFKNIRLDAVYSSSLTRARQTAAPLAAVHGLEVQPVEDIKEIAFGKWEGLTYNQINDASLGQIDEFFKNPALCHVPGGENFTDVAARVEPLFKRCLAEMDEKQAEQVKRCLVKIPEIAKALGLENGYRLIVNQGKDAGQTVFHLHIHILGGENMGEKLL